MKVQADFSNIKRSLADDIIKGQYKNGYVKVCAGWVKRMWGIEEDGPQSLLKLNDYSEVFDACGAYDGTKDQGSVPKGSKYPAWSNALKFLEWFQVQKMDGFGIIIVDNENEKAYDNIPGISDLVTDLDCFNFARYLSVSIGIFSVLQLLSSI